MQALVYEFWKNSSPNKAKETIQFLLVQDNFLEYLEILLNVPELCEYFCSYCWILKDEVELEVLLNRKEIPTELICKIIYFGFGKYIREGNTNHDFYFTQWTKHLKSEQSLRLLKEESMLARDPAFKMHLFANLSAAAWESFFNDLDLEKEGLSQVLESFSRIDPLHRNRLFYRNPTLYQYLRMILVNEKEVNRSEFLKDLREVLNKIYKWEEYATMIKATFDPKSDRDKVPKNRNSDRLTRIYHDAAAEASVDDVRDFLEYLTINGAIVDETEFGMILGLAENLKKQKPLLF